ncbi:MAG: phosphatase PAP2 family protein [Bacteroidetes bacterium]|uniref:Phosphatase PAP2 family protein n=1 Tax=Candidatus Cryptobacteroides merdavium TaxID=2840769 RepID=A0A9D9ED00_9BACT|nr:phosphatase PAP2 family protein [Candidatus Cryptobacteroides merdavium]
MFWQNIHDIDQQITLFINSFHSAWSDPVMMLFSHVRIWFPMYGIIAALLFWRLGWKKGLITVLSCVLCVVLCDQTANLFKDGIARLRPCQDQETISMGLYMLETGGGLYGFFSGHAANSFGFAVCSTMGFRNDKRLKYRGYAAWIFFWAFMVSISRIFVGKHYFGDVLVGAIFGILFGLLCAWLARFAIRKLVK